VILPRRSVPASDRPLLVLLLPCALEEFALRERAEDLLAAPGALAVEPARVSYSALNGLPAVTARTIARRQARRMQLPGTPRAVAVFGPLQVRLATAIVDEHNAAELWYLPVESVESAPGPRERALEAAAIERAALTRTLEPAADARTANLPLWERMEALGIESGRLGSERAQP
jgi:hypothetical protein